MSSFDAARVSRIGTSVDHHVDSRRRRGRGLVGGVRRRRPTRCRRPPTRRDADRTRQPLPHRVDHQAHRGGGGAGAGRGAPPPTRRSRRRVAPGARRSTRPRRPVGPIDGETVAAERPITVHDVLSFRTGLGMDFHAPFPQPLLQAIDELGIGTAPPARRWPLNPTSGSAGSEHCRCSTNRVHGGRTTTAPTSSVSSSPVRPARRSSRWCAIASSHHSEWSTPHSRRPSRAARILVRTEPGDGRAGGLRSPRGSVVDATRVPVGRRRTGVDGRRPLRVRPHVARRVVASRTAIACSRARPSTP